MILEVRRMPDAADKLFSLYDRGLASRRELIQGLLLLAVPGSGLAQSTGTTTAALGHTVNHVQLQVGDLAASTDFYAKLVGAKKVRENNPDTWALAMPGEPTSIITLQRTPNRIGVVDHFGIGIRDFNAQSVAAAVKRILPTADAQVATGGVPAVGVRDPDGILVQLNSAG
jgi:catechol 2,3-dioxygenase-like lactoylglutathione lyase family enzyme